MAKYVNKGVGDYARPIHVGTYMLVPGQEVEIPDETVAKVKGFKRLLESGEVAVVGGAAKAAAPAQKKPDADQPQDGKKS